MEITEIILLVAGGLIFILSFFIPDGRRGAGEGKRLPEDSDRLTEQELRAAEERAERLVEEVLETALEKAERSLEKLSNEKIMAVSEYSDTVLAEIHKNHEEAVFLYDMLNNKHTGLKNALGELNRAVREAEAAGAALDKEAAGAGLGRKQPEADVRESAPEQLAEGRSPAGTGAYAGKQPLGRTAAAEQEHTAREETSGPAQAELSQGSEGQERNNNAKILELYRQGKTILDIAKELDLGMGEVKLVVELFKK